MEVSSIPQLEPEKLLYESFVLKYLEKYLSSSDESTSDEMEGLTSTAISQELDLEKEVTKYRVAQNFSDSSGEMTSVDLDLENLDWDEPFDLEENDSPTLSNLDSMESNCGVIFISPSKQTSVDEKQEEANKKSENNEVGNNKCWECPICLENSTGQEIVTTLCGHIYCRQCLESYLSTTSESCPSCRTDLSGKSFVRLFNI